ncbi:MAG: citrate/2-methylcitrate synthase [Gaiellaceae bacterium]
MPGPKKSVQLSGVTVAQSAICSIDPDRGVLMYRGYDIADLAEHSTYEETAYLLLEGELPAADQLVSFRRELADRELPPATTALVDRSAVEAAPMDLLRTAVSSLSFGESIDERRTAARLIARLPTIVARYHRLRRGLDAVEPDPSLAYSENFLRMLHGGQRQEAAARAFDVVMILHAEHEMNASTFAARVVAGTLADLTSAVTAAVAALAGPLHGGANERAMEFFERVGSPDRAAEEVAAAFERKETLYGFGHPLYRAYDPRAIILKRLARDLAEDRGEPNWYAIAEATERAVSETKGLHPNVDLYSGSVLRYLGIPNELFTPLFAASRVAGWSAHVLEQHADNKIIRPSADYVGEPPRRFPNRN